MPRHRQAIGSCPKCQSESLNCTYNRFVGEDSIDSWEHRCTNCSHRETQAYRASDPPDDPSATPKDPRVCPFCGRHAPNNI